MTTSCTRALIAILLFALPMAAQTPFSLTTSFASNNGCQGNMFDVVAANPIIIESFDINANVGSYTAEVWTLTAGGSYVGSESNMAAWTMQASTPVTVTAVDTATPLGLSLGITLGAGSTLGVYVTLQSATSIRYINGSLPGTTAAQDCNVQILEGLGHCSQFSAGIATRVFSGTMHYTVASATCANPYQTNRPNLNFDIDGVQSNGFAPAITTVNTNQTATATIASPLMGNGWDLGIQVAPLIPSAALTPTFQVLNIGFGSAVFLNSSNTAPNFLPFPGNLSFPVVSSSAVTLSAQAVIIDPSKSGWPEPQSGCRTAGHRRWQPRSGGDGVRVDADDADSRR